MRSVLSDSWGARRFESFHHLEDALKSRIFRLIARKQTCPRVKSLSRLFRTTGAIPALDRGGRRKNRGFQTPSRHRCSTRAARRSAPRRTAPGCFQRRTFGRGCVQSSGARKAFFDFPASPFVSQTIIIICNFGKSKNAKIY